MRIYTSLVDADEALAEAHRQGWTRARIFHVRLAPGEPHRYLVAEVNRFITEPWNWASCGSCVDFVPHNEEAGRCQRHDRELWADDSCTDYVNRSDRRSG